MLTKLKKTTVVGKKVIPESLPLESEKLVNTSEDESEAEIQVQFSSTSSDSDVEITPGQTAVIIEDGQRLSEDPLQESECIQQASIVAAKEVSVPATGLSQQMNLIELIELLWSPLFIRVIVITLKNVERMLVKERNLEMKRIVMSLQMLIMSALKTLKIDSKELRKCSFRGFVNVVQKDALFTTSMKRSLPTHLVDLIIQTYEKDTEEPCSSSAAMMNTSMSSTTARTTTMPVDVPSWKGGNVEKTLEEDFLEELLPVSNTPSNIGSISWFISLRIGANTASAKLSSTHYLATLHMVHFRREQK
ncbi:uncharacterized protein LOC118734233 [Rhagoletis pomonella]|uniref:uncharacterized protein LOC118734233 n=1 Tax=Rhagoletis pomonella TaxID=28610 RepID=UPI0017860903|nr:uncharacterized protein LOC118734233 [Rhagoletis pomonella]